MQMLNLGRVVLTGFLMGASGVLIASDLDNEVDQLNEKSSLSTFPVSNKNFSLEALLQKPEIKLSDGKVLSVVLDEKLKQQLEDEQGSGMKKATDLFMKYFEKTKSAKVSNKVIGFYFALNDEKVYCKTFLGENAK